MYTEQNFAHLCCAYYSWYGGEPSYAHFDVHVALVQYTSRTLFVDFRCSDSKYSRIVFYTYSKYGDDNLPDLNMQFDVFSTLFMNALSTFKFVHVFLVIRVYFIYAYFLK